MKNSLLALALLTTTTAHAGPVTLAGDQIDAAMIRTIDTGYGLGRISGYGLDAPFVVQDGNADQHQYSSAFKLNVDGNSFSIWFLSMAGWQDGIFLRLSDLDFSPMGSTLSSVNVDTNLVGYTLAAGPDWVDIGLGGTHFTAGTYFTGTFDVSSVPEPASMALVSLGLLAVSALRKRREILR